MRGTQNRLRGFDEQAAQVFASVPANPSAPFSFTAVVKGRVEANIFDQFACVSKTLDVADDGPQGKGYLVPDAAQPHDGQEQRVG